MTSPIDEFKKSRSITFAHDSRKPTAPKRVLNRLSNAARKTGIVTGAILSVVGTSIHLAVTKSPVGLLAGVGGAFVGIEMAGAHGYQEFWQQALAAVAVGISARQAAEAVPVAVGIVGNALTAVSGLKNDAIGKVASEMLTIDRDSQVCPFGEVAGAMESWRIRHAREVAPPPDVPRTVTPP